MKFRIAQSCLLALFMAMAAGQSQKPDSDKVPKPEKKSPLFFVTIAADVAVNVQHGPLNGYLGIYVDDQNWAAGLKDGDLSPFLKLKEAKTGRSAVLFFSEAKDSAICVFFDGNAPFGAIAIRAGAGGKIEAGDIPAAYKDVSQEMLKKSNEEMHFTDSDVSTDDGDPLPGFVVTSTEKSKA